MLRMLRCLFPESVVSDFMESCGGIVTKQDHVWGLPHVPFLGRQVDGGGFITADARIFYELGGVMFNLKVNNVFNKKYYTSAFPALRGGIFAGQPRDIIGSVKYTF
jgi:outer membrane receptor protein involved in Fe transport